MSAISDALYEAQRIMKIGENYFEKGDFNMANLEFTVANSIVLAILIQVLVPESVEILKEIEEKLN